MDREEPNQHRSERGRVQIIAMQITSDKSDVKIPFKLGCLNGSISLVFIVKI